MTRPTPTSVAFRPAGPAGDAEIRRWLEDYIELPHPELGRSGAVCPYATAANRAGLIHILSATWTSPLALSDQLIQDVLYTALDLFDGRTWPDGPARLRSLVILLSSLPEPQWPLLDAAHAAVKTHAMERGRMIGQFHPLCPAPAAHNPDFTPNRAPHPLIVVRSIAAHDVLFAQTPPQHAAHARHFSRAPGQTARYGPDHPSDQHK